MIAINEIVKKYRELEVLKGIDVSIERGSSAYLVGPNGSGKTTLIKLILGLVKPTSGEILFEGEKLNGNFRYREKIGYMPQLANFPENLTVEEVFRLIKNVRFESSEYDEELVEKFNLRREFKKRVRNLSGGTKQKVSAAIAFLFNPDVLILDEPTSGLDPVSSSLLKDKIIRENRKGKTLILTSHILSELEELAERVVFLLEGKIAFDGSIDGLISKTESRNLERAVASLMNGDAV